MQRPVTQGMQQLTNESVQSDQCRQLMTSRQESGLGRDDQGLPLCPSGTPGRDEQLGAVSYSLVADRTA